MRITQFWITAALAGCLALLQPAAAQAQQGNLVSAQWLQGNLGRADLLLLDASPQPVYAAKHIPGAVHVNVFGYAAAPQSPADMQRRFQSWGIGADRRIVIYDEGGTFWATRVFFDLVVHGFPPANLFVLDGGLARWQGGGGATTAEPTPAPAAGTFRVAAVDDTQRTGLATFLAASGDPARYALVDANSPANYYGEAKFFDRAGHVPNAVMMPSADFFNADKTFKSPEEIRRLAAFVGVRPEQQVFAHCGGGLAASVPYFALKFIAGYPKVGLFPGSQLEWLRDDRGLPFWTYGAPQLRRDALWLHTWGGGMIRGFGLSNISVVDLRSAEAYRQGHLPAAASVPAAVFASHVAEPQKLAERLGAAGVNAADEAVIVSDGGLNPGAALAFVLLEQLGQKKVSILMESVDDWALRGYTLVKPAAEGAGGKASSPRPLDYKAPPRPGVVAAPAPGRDAAYPRVYLAAGPNPPAAARDGQVVHVPYTQLLEADGTPKAAKDLWNILGKAGLPRYAEIVCVADDPGAAAIAYYLLRLMGYPDVKVLLA